ncbi:MAG: hypothetical protein JRD04_04755 [Deltaproteobacteria bacterium]|nr:hypothetical protein [Deltaproteobacteria bacterium]
MKRVTQWILFLFVVGWMGFPAALAENNGLPTFNAGIDQLAFQLTHRIATRYYDVNKRPVVRVAVFDFASPEGSVTVGSRYVSNRIRMAFAEGTQFELLSVGDLEKRGLVITSGAFSKSGDLRELVVDHLKADAYIFGRVAIKGDSNATCQADIWGTAPPYDRWYRIKPLEFDHPAPWNLGLSPSGTRFFTHVLLESAEELIAEAKQETLGKVVFLSQPVCDDLNLSWQIRADGMVYDTRKESKTGSLRNRTGQVLQSRVKSDETLKELSYIIQDATLIIKEQDGMAHKFEPYVLPEKSDYYFLPFNDDETGLRFQYIWGKPGLSKRISTHETGKGWKLHLALEDYENILPVGTHVATASLSPMAESQYGSKRPRSDYVTRFKFSVTPGLNIYIVNYVYRRDRPEIFIRRLDIEGTRDVPIKSVKKITEVYRVYGSD